MVSGSVAVASARRMASWRSVWLPVGRAGRGVSFDVNFSPGFSAVGRSVVSGPPLLSPEVGGLTRRCRRWERPQQPVDLGGVKPHELWTKAVGVEAAVSDAPADRPRADVESVSGGSDRLEPCGGTSAHGDQDPFQDLWSTALLRRLRALAARALLDRSGQWVSSTSTRHARTSHDGPRRTMRTRRPPAAASSTQPARSSTSTARPGQ